VIPCGRLATPEPGAGRAAPWLLLVARKALANQRRASARADDKARRAATGGAAATPDPAEALAARDALMRAFVSLADRDREALRLVARRRRARGRDHP
jgi:hypothetical protein